MKNPGCIQRLLYKDQGAVIVLVAILLFVLLGVTAFAIDFGYRHVVRNELQNAADAAALAAARELGEIYGTLTYTEQQTYVADPSTIIPIAQEAALLNYAGDVGNLAVNAPDVIIGDWDFAQDPSVTDPLTPTLNQPDAVRVTTRRDDNANGPVATFFASIFNISSLPVTAKATAALSGQSIAEPGEIELPVGISKYWFDNPDYCNDVIAFSPSNDPASCAGWHTFTSSPANDKKVRDILENFIETGESGSPTIISGETDLEFIGGELSTNTFESLMVSFQKNGYDISALDADGIGIPITDAGGNPINNASGTGQEIALCTSTDKPKGVTRCDAPNSTGTPAYYPDDPTTKGVTENVARNLHAWQTTLPVYDRNDCSNPNQSIRTAGFALIEIQDVGGPSDKTIKGRVLCNYVENEDVRGGGSNFGTLGSVPGLVE